VEEAAAAAESLQDQAASLSQAVAVFKTSGGGGRIPVAGGASVGRKCAAPSATPRAKLPPARASTAPGPVRAMQRNATQNSAASEDEWEEF
jgi:methyl-accepting chemotaxis protein